MDRVMDRVEDVVHWGEGVYPHPGSWAVKRASRPPTDPQKVNSDPIPISTQNAVPPSVSDGHTHQILSQSL